MLKCLVRKAIVKAPLRVSVSVSRMTAARASPQRLAGGSRVRDGGPAKATRLPMSSAPSPHVGEAARLLRDLLPWEAGFLDAPRPFAPSASAGKRRGRTASPTLLVNGCGRSGTHALVMLLRRAGISALHEGRGREATVGWPYAGHLNGNWKEYWPMSNQPHGGNDVHDPIFKVHRHPLTAIGSIAPGLTSSGGCRNPSERRWDARAWHCASHFVPLPVAQAAITAQETMLQTYGPAHEIHNAFGLGPGIVFPDEAAAITMAARTLGNYAADGLTTIRAISGRWAPVGASNDPRGLNAGWSDGVGTFFAALGGDPMLPVLTTAQNPAPTCAPAGSTAAPGASISASGIIPAVTPTDGPAMVTIWGGLVPAATGTALAQGGDPTSRRPAVIDGFAFPLAPPASAPVRYVDAASEPVVLTSAPGVTVVAPLAGRLRIASAADQRRGIGFWIVSTGGDRVGLGALAAYEDGLSEGVVVPAGQVLGHSNGSLAVAWRRGRVPVAIFPLLSATRPSD